MISASIITKNEEPNIERCLKSISWADEIVIVDSGSTDNTIDICNKFHCKIIETDWLGFGKTKQLGVNSCSHPWILSIDADEEVTPQLKDAILLKTQTITSKTVAYKIKRESYYLNKKIHYSGWNNDYPLRLFMKNSGQFNDAAVHESVIILNGTISTITAPLLHYPYPTIHKHLEKINQYSSLGAESHLHKNKHSSLLYALLSGTVKFLKMYIVKRGFLDGKEGAILAILSGFGSFTKYAKLWSLKKGL